MITAATPFEVHLDPGEPWGTVTAREEMRERPSYGGVRDVPIIVFDIGTRLQEPQPTAERIQEIATEAVQACWAEGEPVPHDVSHAVRVAVQGALRGRARVDVSFDVSIRWGSVAVGVDYNSIRVDTIGSFGPAEIVPGTPTYNIRVGTNAVMQRRSS